jgi:hypothetical protein
VGLRFRRSIRLAPGMRINLSKSLPSLSFGRSGATLNTNAHGIRTTVGVPGSGLSYSTNRMRWRQAVRGSAVRTLAEATIALAILDTLFLALLR